MNAQEAFDKLDAVGGNPANLSSNDLYDVFRALQGSFAYSDEFAKINSHIGANKAALAADAQLQDKMLNDVKTDIKDLDGFRDAYDTVVLFGASADVRKMFAKDAYKAIENYTILDSFSPDELDVLEAITGNLKEDIDNGTLKVTATEKKFVEKFIKKIEKETDAFVKANDLEDIDQLDTAVIEQSFDAASSISEDLKNATGLYAQELAKGNEILSAVELTGKGTDNITNEQFREKADSIAMEEAIRRCSLDPTFASKPLNEQKLALINARNEAIESFVRDAMVADATATAVAKFQSGQITAKDKKEIERKVLKAFEDFKKGKVSKITIGRNAALATIVNAESNIKAVGKYIAKKTGFDRFFNKAQRRWKELEKEYPIATTLFKATALGIGKGAVKMAAVIAATAVNPALGIAVSTTFAVRGYRKAKNGIMAKYKNDPAYAGKTFDDYLRDNKLDKYALVASGVGAALAGGLGVASLSSSVPNIGGTMKRILRGGVGLVQGTTMGASAIAKAKTKEERKLAWAQLGGSAATAAVMMIFGEEIAETIQKNLGTVSFVFNKGDAFDSNGAVGNETENQAEETDKPITGKDDATTDLKSEVSGEENDEKGAVDKFKDGVKGLWDKLFGSEENEATGPAKEGTDEATKDETKSDVKDDATKDDSKSDDGEEKETRLTKEYNTEDMTDKEKSSYNRSLSYTKNYLQALENEDAKIHDRIPERVSLSESKAYLDAKLNIFVEKNPELVAYAAAQGVSAAEIYNVAQMEELQFHRETYSRSYSETVKLNDGYEYKTHQSSVTELVRNCLDGLSAEEQFKIFAAAANNYDDRGNVIADPKYASDAWRGIKVVAGVALGEDCGERVDVKSFRMFEASTTKTEEVAQVIQNVVNEKTVETVVTVEHRQDNFEDIKLTHEEVVEKEPEVLKETPKEQQPVEKGSLHEIVGSSDEVMDEVAKAGFIPDEKDFKYVGEEAAIKYFNGTKEEYYDYGKSVRDSEWAVPVKNVHSVPGDPFQKTVESAMKAPSPEFFYNDEKPYVVAGSPVHGALAEMYPEQYKASYENSRPGYEGSINQGAESQHSQSSASGVNEVRASTGSGNNPSAQSQANLGSSNDASTRSSTGGNTTPSAQDQVDKVAQDMSKEQGVKVTRVSTSGGNSSTTTTTTTTTTTGGQSGNSGVVRVNTR